MWAILLMCGGWSAGILPYPYLKIFGIPKTRHEKLMEEFKKMEAPPIEYPEPECIEVRGIRPPPPPKIEPVLPAIKVDKSEEERRKAEETERLIWAHYYSSPPKEPPPEPVTVKKAKIVREKEEVGVWV